MGNVITNAIPNREPDERVWVIRASGGQFVRHFKKIGVVAIGHLDKLDLAPLVGTEPEVVSLSLKATARQLVVRHNMPKRAVTSHISQVEKFCSGIKYGDLVVTVDSASIAVGRVTGHAFFDRTPVDLSSNNYKDKPMKFQLRRPVAWGPTYPRAKLPLPLERVFNQHRTVFEISKHWDLIYHLLYPVFMQGDDAHVSLQVQKREAIKNSSLVQLLSLLRDFEQLSARLAEEDDLWDTLTIQAGFYSPGDIWPKLVASKNKTFLFFLCLSVLLNGAEVEEISIGGTNIGPVKINGLIKQTLDGAANIIEKHHGRAVVKELQIQMPKHNTESLDKQHDAPVNEETILLA